MKHERYLHVLQVLPANQLLHQEPWSWRRSSWKSHAHQHISLGLHHKQRVSWVDVQHFHNTEDYTHHHIPQEIPSCGLPSPMPHNVLKHLNISEHHDVILVISLISIVGYQGQWSTLNIQYAIHIFLYNPRCWAICWTLLDSFM